MDMQFPKKALVTALKEGKSIVMQIEFQFQFYIRKWKNNAP